MNKNLLLPVVLAFALPSLVGAEPPAPASPARTDSATAHHRTSRRATHRKARAHRRAARAHRSRSGKAHGKAHGKAQAKHRTQPAQ
jgi:hypothetical protein